MTDEEGAKLFRVSVPTFRRRVRDGSVPKPTKLGGCSRWRLSELGAARRRLEAERDGGQ